MKEIILDLEKHGGSLDEFSFKKIINDQTIHGTSILHMAIEKKDHELCTFLIEKGADVNLILKNGDSPLHLASRFGNLEMVKLLLNLGVNIDAQNHKLESPLYQAAKEDNVEVVKYLILK